jgi:hypothetical protein
LSHLILVLAQDEQDKEGSSQKDLADQNQGRFIIIIINVLNPFTTRG